MRTCRAGARPAPAGRARPGFVAPIDFEAGAQFGAEVRIVAPVDRGHGHRSGRRPDCCSASPPHPSARTPQQRVREVGQPEMAPGQQDTRHEDEHPIVFRQPVVQTERIDRRPRPDGGEQGQSKSVIADRRRFSCLVMDGAPAHRTDLPREFVAGHRLGRSHDLNREAEHETRASPLMAHASEPADIRVAVVLQLDQPRVAVVHDGHARQHVVGRPSLRLHHAVADFDADAEP